MNLTITLTPEEAKALNNYLEQGLAATEEVRAKEEAHHKKEIDAYDAIKKLCDVSSEDAAVGDMLFERDIVGPHKSLIEKIDKSATLYKMLHSKLNPA